MYMNVKMTKDFLPNSRIVFEHDSELCFFYEFVCGTTHSYDSSVPTVDDKIKWHLTIKLSRIWPNAFSHSLLLPRIVPKICWLFWSLQWQGVSSLLPTGQYPEGGAAEARELEGAPRVPHPGDCRRKHHPAGVEWFPIPEGSLTFVDMFFKLLSTTYKWYVFF